MKAKGWPGWEDKIAALQEQIAGCTPFVGVSERGGNPTFLESDPGAPIEDGQSRNVKPYQVIINAGIQPTPIALNPKPGWVTITNLSSTDIWIGGSDVTPLTGQLLAAGRGNSVKIKTVADWWGVCNPGQSGAVSVIVGLELAVFFLNSGSKSSVGNATANFRYIKTPEGSSGFSMISGYSNNPATIGTAGSIPSSATDTNYATLTSFSTAGSFAGLVTYGGTLNGPTLGALSFFQTKAGLLQTANCRWWLGYCNTNSQNDPALAADNPAKQLVAFRYSSNAGDINFQCYVSIDATNFTTVDSGILADTKGHTFIIQSVNNGATIKFFIDGALVATVSNSNIPSPSQTLSEISIMDNVGLPNAVGWKDSYFYMADIA